MNRKRKHEVEKVYHKKSRMYVEIDTGIVTLIKLLWELGIDTSQSCMADYEHANKIWIQFGNVKSVEKFLNIIGDYDDPKVPSDMNFYNAIMGNSKNSNFPDFEFRFNIYDRKLYIVDDFLANKQLDKKGYYTGFSININMWFTPLLKDKIIKKLIKYKK